MRILICGMDGYIGWPLSLHLRSKGHDIVGIDNMSRRKYVNEVGGSSVLPISSFKDRDIKSVDVTSYNSISSLIATFVPECIVHLAEQPSAPYSMIDVEHASSTQRNNVIGTLNLLFAIKEHCPTAHLLKLGTMGEYGTPNCSIPEEGPHKFPRQPGSLYHASKVHDSVNIEFACRSWNLRSTDVMQGVVYGTRTDEISDPKRFTRFDVDECFGTAINRFCAQAIIGMPLTVYGSGKQKRGFLPLRDSIQCLNIAIENPPNYGEYRVFNQFENHYSIINLAESVAQIMRTTLDISIDIDHVHNPRTELEDHFYEPQHDKLYALGYKPTTDMAREIKQMLMDLLNYSNKIELIKDSIFPKTKWN